MTKVFPHFKAELTFLLLALGLIAVVWYYLRTRPQTPAEVARFLRPRLLLAMFIAPATRFGYAIYPANLLVWSYLLAGPRASSAAGDEPNGRRPAVAAEPGVTAADPLQSPSSTSKMRRVMRLVGAVAGPPAEGRRDGGLDRLDDRPNLPVVAVRASRWARISRPLPLAGFDTAKVCQPSWRSQAR